MLCTLCLLAELVCQYIQAYLHHIRRAKPQRPGLETAHTDDVWVVNPPDTAVTGCQHC